MSHSRTIGLEEKLNVLLRCTNINVKIIACLQASNGGLSEDQASEIEAIKALRKQCQLLYDWIEKSHDLYTCFVNVMEENEQIHVANYLKGNCEEPHVPMSVARYERLIRIKPKLMDSIYYSEILVSNLEAKKAISLTDCQDVRVDVLAKYKRIYLLINSIQRRSNHSFLSFDEALRATHQGHAADFLYDGEVVALHVNTSRPELEKPLSQALNETIVKEFATDSPTNQTVLEELNGRRSYVLSSKPEKSIMVFLYCKTPEDMALFMKDFNSGHLKSIITRILNRLMSSLPNKTKENLEIKLSLDDEEVLLIEEFTGNEDWMPGRFHSRKCVDSGDRAIKDEPVVKIEKKTSDWQPFGPSKDKPDAYMDEVMDEKHCGSKEHTYDLMPPTCADEIPRKKFLDMGVSEIKGRNLYLEFKLELERAENGRLKVQVKQLKELLGKLRYKSNPFLVFTIRIKAAKEELKPIAGMTILNVGLHKKLFVVSVKSSKVNVYDSFQFDLNFQWNLKELVDPLDIASCDRNKCLYIFDFKGVNQSREILRVDQNGKLIKKWSTEDDLGIYWGCGMSVTNESNVIITVFNKAKINEYSPDGQLIHAIKLSDAGVVRPFHAVKLTIGHFMVSHQDGLCVVDADGNLRKSFNEERGSTIEQINFPVYLSVDEHGYVLVADSVNRRVLLLDSDLQFSREILSTEKQELQRPHRILLDEANGRLLVADNELKNHRVVIFSIFNQ